MRPTRCGRRGAVMVYFVFVLIVLIGFVGLALDWGYVFLTAQQLQNAADGAALAGAQRVLDGPEAVREAAAGIAGENDAGGETVGLADNPDNDPDGDVVVGVYDRATRTFTAIDEDDDDANAVRVVARRTAGSPRDALPLFFGPVFGKDTADVSRFAIAMAEHGPSGPGIILLKSSGPKGLDHSGNGTVTVNGPLYVNSTDSNEALYKSGNGTLEATSFEVVGGAYTTGTVIGDMNTGVDPVADPYAALPVPPYLTDTANYPVIRTSKLSLGAGTHVLQPGRYIGGIDLSGSNAFYTMSPGIYIIEGGGFKLSGTLPCTLIANGVMIYNTGTSGTTSNADQFLISGDSIVEWAPIVGGTYDGFGLFQNRNVSDKKVQISGNGSVNITSIIYAKSAEVQLSGNGDTQVLGGGFVAASMQISGDGSFSVGGDTAGGPGADTVYLVE